MISNILNEDEEFEQFDSKLILVCCLSDIHWVLPVFTCFQDNLSSFLLGLWRNDFY